MGQRIQTLTCLAAAAYMREVLHGKGYLLCNNAVPRRVALHVPVHATTS